MSYTLGTCVEEVRGQFERVGSLLLPHGAWDSNSGLLSGLAAFIL